MITGTLSILVVESEAAVAAPLVKALELNGHRVTCCGSARRALSGVDHDVAIIALDLADGCGLATCEQLRLNGSALRILMTADQPTADDYRQAMQLGVADLFATPFELDELVRSVEVVSTRTVRSDVRRESYVREYRAISGTVEEAARDLASYLLRCGISPSTRTRVATACAEAVDNAVRHAYPGSFGTVSVELSANERELSLRIVDAGIGFDSVDICLAHLNADSKSGLARASALAENIHVHSDIGHGSCIELRFSAFRVLFDEDDHVDLSELDFLTPRTARRVIDTLNDADAADLFRLSPALAVSVGRLLAGPDPRRSLQTALWS